MSVADYLKERHMTLVDDYRTPDGEHPESCIDIACDVAEMMLAEGRLPEIVTFSEPVREGMVEHHKDLRPVIYGGRVIWSCHHVCVCDDTAYDPIVGKPVPLEDYSTLVFGEQIRNFTRVPRGRIIEFVSR